MRIATFNLENLDFPPKAAMPIEERIALLRPQIERTLADVVCLQEVNGQRIAGEKERALLALDRLLEGTPFAEYHRAATRGPDGHSLADVHNLVILSRYAIVREREIRHEFVAPLAYHMTTAVAPEGQSGADDNVGWDRPLLLADLDLGDGRELTVINLHLRAPLAAAIPGQKEAPFVWKSVGGWAEGYFLSAVKRVGQALEARLAVERILEGDPDRLIAVCGDFNADNNEMPLKTLIASEEDTGNGRLAARMLIPLDRSIAEDRRYSVLHHGRAQMLDHILVTRSLLGHFCELEIHNETLEDELVAYAKVDRPPDSYHAPVVAEFTFQQAADRSPPVKA